MPAIFFRYELSPIRIQYTIELQKVSVFLVRICAIIGGIYSVSSIFESLLRNSISIFGFGAVEEKDAGRSTMKRDGSSSKKYSEVPEDSSRVNSSIELEEIK